MIVKILIARRQSQDPLGDDVFDLVLYRNLKSSISKTGGSPSEQVNLRFSLPQQQNAGVRGHLSAVKAGFDLTAFNSCETKRWFFF